MPGPPPGAGALHHSVRGRRNRTSTAAELLACSPEERALIEVPELPSDRLWDPHTSDFWVAAWQSPMRLEWDAGDEHKLLMMAYLLDEFYETARDREMKASTRANTMSTLSKSIVQLGARLGLDPFARRSLQWIMIQTDKAEAETENTQARTAQTRAKTARTSAKTDKAAARKKRGLKGLE